MAAKDDPSDWSDATRSLLRAPTIDRVEYHAKDLLSRALNSGRVTGFVGAGASMAYGRLSWRDLVLINQEKVLRDSKERQDPKIEALRVLLESQKIKEDGTSSSDEFLPAFQLTEQLDALLHAKPAGQGRPGETSAFRRNVAAMVADDRGHLHHILSTVLDDTDLPAPDAVGDAECPGIRRADCLRFLCRAVNEAFPSRPEVQAVTTAVEALVPHGQDFTRPYHRFAIGLLLALLPPGCRRKALKRAALGAKRTKEKDEDAALPTAKPALRAELLPRERDPLRLMLALRIGRFLTTNYDREIENLLAAEGYAHLSDDERDDPSGSGRQDLLAPDSSDMVFDSAHTGHLLAFAAHTRRREAAVVHLHGRADRDEPLIITEEDYQRRYLAEDGNRSLMEDSLRAAFTSSPLLFVGSGLGEDDLVRPLRQFVHDPTVGAGRIAVALLPMRSADEKKAQAAVIRNLQRYGVHTVHYGHAAASESAETNWLGSFLDLLGELSKAIAPDASAECRSVILLRLSADVQAYTPPVRMEDVEVALHPGLDISGELQLLKALAKLVTSSGNPLAKERQAIRLCITGIDDSVTGAFLCARLIRVHNDWSQWRDAWLELTVPEEPANAIKVWAKAKGAKPFRRHHVHLPEAEQIENAKHELQKDKQRTVEGAPRSFKEIRQDSRLLRQRFDARAYSPTFLSLHKAMHDKSVASTAARAGRRIFLLVTHRGVGKGHFATALGQEEYFEVFLKDLGCPDGKRWPAAMFNFSFSHEVSSTFDQLAAFLQDRGRELAGEKFGQCAKTADALKGDRLARLKELLTGWGSNAQAFSGNRAIVVFNRFGALFDEQGYAKNAQTARLFELLTGGASERAPIDLVLLCSDHSLPLKFRRTIPDPKAVAQQGPVPPAPFSFVELREPGLSETANRELDRRMQAFEKSPTDPKPSLYNFVHIMRPARAILLATSYFPSVAMAIALKEAENQGKKIDYAKLPEVFSPEAAYEFRNNVRNALIIVDRKRVSASDSFPVLLAAAATLQGTGQIWHDLPNVILNWYNTRRELEITPIEEIFGERFIKTYINIGGDQGILLAKNINGILDTSKLIDERFKELFEACGGGRFAFTLLMACAYHHLLPIAEATSANGADAAPSMRRAFERCFGFLDHMRRTLEGLPRSRRDDLLLERVLDAYRSMHEIPGFVLPAGLKFVSQGMQLFDLMQAILWHLSAIGQPVVTDVLLEIPAIEAAARRATKDQSAIAKNAKPAEVRLHLRNVIVDAMFLLEFRCLVFEIHSSHLKSDDRNGENDGQRRWAVHRLVQRHVFLTLRAPYVDYADTDSFALTLFDSMPNDVPRLTATNYRRLFGLVSALTAYPEPDTEQVGHSVWRDGPNNSTTLRARGQLLRGALGVVRSSLSISTLLRLDTREPDPDALPASYGAIQRGVLDEHRLMLEWLLTQVGRFSKSLETLTAENQDPVQRPLYAEEVVWLHNEIGTTALVQGRMADAVAHYNRADRMARQHLEPAETGPLRVRIALNRAHADIGRGRLRQAEVALERISAVTNEHRVIGPIACSVLALVQHIRGRNTAATPLYQKAAEALQHLKRSRASASVLRHYGDLLRKLHNLSDASRQLDQAYTFAVEGNHEDVRHLVVLSRIRLDLQKDGEPGASASTRRDQHRKLDEAETYGRVMGIPHLQCEVALMRAELHIRDGDLKTAATVASGGLALACVNDMQIRSTSFVLILSDLYVAREQYEAARPLLNSALRLARVNEYHSAHQRASEMMARISAVTRFAG